MTQTFRHSRPLPHLLLALAIFMFAGGAVRAAVSVENGKAPDFELLGVVAAGLTPKAMINLPGADSEIMVAQGDLVSGYTICQINEDSIELQRGAERRMLMLPGARCIQPEGPSKIACVNGVEKPSGEFKTAEILKVAEAQTRKKATERLKLADREKFASLAGRPQLIRPIQGGYISSGFGLRWHPLGGSGKSFHAGIDIAGAHGGTVYAAAPGVVTVSAYGGDRGRWIAIQHSGNYETRYYHLSKQYVEEGALVKTGQAIGAEGNSGATSGPHLHFEVRKDGNALDPSLFVPSLRY